MRLPRIMCETHTAIKRVPRVDVNGKKIRDADGIPIVDDVPFTVTRSSLQPASTNETLGSADITEGLWVLYAPPDNPDLSSTAAVMRGDVKLEIAGDVQVWNDKHGQPHHVEIPLREVAG